MSERIMTLHPSGKAGVNIEKSKYGTIAAAIKAELRTGDATFYGMTDAIIEKLQDSFDGSVGWYVTTVKLDLEARGIIERVGEQSPQILHLCES